MSRRKLYIPITRSGSSILASIGTQILMNAFENKNAQQRQPHPYPYLMLWFYIIFGGTFGFVAMILVIWALNTLLGVR